MSKVANQCLDLSNYSFKFTNEAAKSCPPVYKKGSHSVPLGKRLSAPVAMDFEMSMLGINVPSLCDILNFRMKKYVEVP